MADNIIGRNACLEAMKGGRKIYSITKNLAGASLIEFQGTHKTVYCSRNYYKALKDIITP